VDSPASHVEQAVAARIAAARARRAKQAAARAAFAERRRHGLAARHRAKLRRLDADEPLDDGEQHPAEGADG
jgi:hypothetical protein